MPDQATIRQQLRAQRRNLSSTEQRANSTAVVRILMGSQWFLNSQRLALYLANDGELDIEPLLHHALALGKSVYLPVIDQLPSNRLWFAPYRQATPLLVNRYGIPEPVTPHREHVPPWALDLILLPLVGFDEAGNRLGMGGGFYDRTLAYRQRRKRWHKPKLIGIAHAAQQVTNLTRNGWDVPLDGVVTELGLRRFKP